MNAESRRNDSVAILVHDIMVAGPVTAANLSLAKGLAAERARAILEDRNSEHCLSRLCDCGKKMNVDTNKTAAVDVDVELQCKPDISDETEEGFAKIAEMTRVEFVDSDPSASMTLVEETAIDEQAVEDMLTIRDQHEDVTFGIAFAV
jgi:endoribonuclease Dicer